MSVRAGINLGRARLRQRSTGVALGLAFMFELGVALLERAQGRIGATTPESESPLDTSTSALALWLIIAGLALTAISLLL